MNKLLAAFCLVLFATAGGVAHAAGAQELAPDALIKTISDDVIGIIKHDKDIKAGNREKINNLVEAKVLPHFNFARMTALALRQLRPKTK